MKAIIQRKLPLNQQYAVIDKKYTPLIESVGICCDNCGQLIANIATVRDEQGKIYEIGFDCLETVLINNSLLSTNDIASYEVVKKMIPKIIRFSKVIKEGLKRNENINITGLLFEYPKSMSDYYIFYWLQNGNTTSRDNDFIKLTSINFEFMLSTLRNIFPKLNIIHS